MSPSYPISQHVKSLDPTLRVPQRSLRLSVIFILPLQPGAPQKRRTRGHAFSRAVTTQTKGVDCRPLASHSLTPPNHPYKITPCPLKLQPTPGPFSTASSTLDAPPSSTANASSPKQP